MNIAPVIYWIRQDFRLHDNPALFHAAKTSTSVIFVYILDETNNTWSIGEASQWWLHEGLLALSKTLAERYDAPLILRKGDPLLILQTLIEETQTKAIFWNRCYEPHAIRRDHHIKQILKQQNIDVFSFNGALLKEPSEILNQSKQPFKVFTPFWRHLLQQDIRAIYSPPNKIIPVTTVNSLTLAELDLLPSIPWYQKIAQSWQPGESIAKNKLKTFLTTHLKQYKEERDHPGLAHTSKLSPHLHFGEISPVQIWHATKHFQARYVSHDADAHHFLSELAWREFSAHLLYHFPTLPDVSFKPAFAKFPWKINANYLTSWQKGLTGYPIVDAGMRELWHSGWMHNRVRMIVASFLIKHLMQPWQAGEKWFWNTLVDADLANNAASWQWVAGSGADAAPYFRIFNPVLQGQKFDPEGIYVKKWVPELNQLPTRYIHTPWEAPEILLKEAKIVLGKVYPRPIVNHATAREKALTAYQKIKKQL